MIKIRIDVDYPCSSRFRSFLYTALGPRTGKDYLCNSKTIARMINESPRQVKAYWFFTYKTLPDKELLAMLNNERNEVALHIVKDPFGELKKLERLTGRKVSFYTFHGIERVFGMLMWRRWSRRPPPIPNGFPLQSFHQFSTGSDSLDSMCYRLPLNQALKKAEWHINRGDVVYFHPDWLFQRGKLNHRGPFYEALRTILSVDKELEYISTSKKLSIRIARDQLEYERNTTPAAETLQKLRERRVDIFTFLDRSWCCKIENPERSWAKANEDIALLNLKTYDEWLKNVGKKTRNMIRKAEKSGITTRVAEPDEKLGEGIWKIYNETPIRQDRGFNHYGTPLHEVVRNVLPRPNSTYIAAYFENELAGFIQLVNGDNIAVISQILSMQKHTDKAVNNALLAKTIETCAARNEKWIMYGGMGNHPSLDNFKQSNGFEKVPITRYYLPLTNKGKIATKLGLQKDAKDVLPQSVKDPLIPIYNWISRTKMKMKLRDKH